MTGILKSTLAKVETLPLIKAQVKDLPYVSSSMILPKLETVKTRPNEYFSPTRIIENASQLIKRGENVGERLDFYCF